MKKILVIILTLVFVSFVLKAQTKKVLLEEFTGAHCGQCPMGSYILDSLLEVYPGLIGVSLHSYVPSDAMYFLHIDTIAAEYAAGAPLGAIDRINFPDGFGYVAKLQTTWNGHVQTRLAVTPTLTVSINPSWDSPTRNITALISTNILSNMPSGDYRFNLYVVEDSVTGTGPGYEQVNFYDGIAGNPFYGMGNPIINYAHRHVVRAILPQAWGQAGIISSTPATGQIFSTTFNYTLPAGYNEDRVMLVAFVSK
jgi:hypothetical protein